VKHDVAGDIQFLSRVAYSSFIFFITVLLCGCCWLSLTLLLMGFRRHEAGGVGFSPGSCCCSCSCVSYERLRHTLQVCYEVLITDHLEVDFGEDHQETDPHVVRVGWSLDSASFQLGNHNNKLVLCPYSVNLVSLIY